MSYNLTQISFILGFYIFRKKEFEFHKHSHFIDNNVDNFVFYFFSLIFLLCQIIIYLLKGIPLFMQSRLETFADGGGAGILGRITDVTSIISLYAFFIVVRFDKFRLEEIPKYIIFFSICISFFLSGSKSSFLVILYVFWCFIFIQRINGGDYLKYLSFIKKHLKKVIVLSLIIVYIIISIQLSNDSDNIGNSINPFYALIIRFVHSGDIYWYAYPNNIYRTIRDDQWFTALFNDTLGFLRIYSWDRLPKAIGITFKDIHHPSDILQGPNARHNIFGLIYFGYVGSILFSFIIGVIIGFIRNRVPYYFSNNIIGGGLVTYLLCKTSAFDTDPMLTITFLDNVIFIFPVLFLMYLVFKEFIRINPKNGL
jgi:oligosaccharide repeat unit polymerase